MSKKNSSVILKEGFKNNNELLTVYQKFKKKIINFKSKSYLVAISGGPDSLALAALTKALNYEKKVKFIYVLVNHNIRKNSLKEANFVKNLLKKNKISLKILSNNKKIEKNIQGKAREIRYRLLCRFCLANKIKTIMTAHNFEDQVETFFIRLSRGSGLKGLSGMKPITNLYKNIKLMRPLLDIKKKMLVKISKIIFGKFVVDPSNTDNKYLRSKVRKLQKPLKLSGIDYDQIFKSINNLASSKNTLDEYHSKILRETIEKSQNKIQIDFQKFKKFNTEIKINILNEAIKKLKKNYYNIRSKKVLNLIKNLQKKSFQKATLGGCIFIVKNEKLCLKKE